MQFSSSKPFIIGVAGGTGSGKTTVVRNIIKFIAPEKVLTISHDDYYRDQTHLPFEEREKTNYDHPNSLETELLIQHIKELSEGKSVRKPLYDFSQHTRSSETEEVQPTRVIIVEGILLFECKNLRNLFDLKVFVDTDADIRILRRIKRDMEERGRDFDFIVQQYLSIVRPMHLEFVEPSKRYADIILPEGGENRVALELLLARVREIVRG